MSFKSTAWAIEQTTGSATTKILLLVLSDHHNSESGLCCPSIGRLASRTELSESTVRRAIKQLAEGGFLTIETRQRKDGSATSNQYRLNMDPVTVTPPPCHGDTTPPVTVTPHRTSNIEPVNKTKRINLCSSVDERFDDWYSIWPRKQGKAEARKHWKKHKCNHIADQIIEHTRQLVDIQYAHLIAKNDKGLIPHASTYINQKRWEDDIVPPGASQLTEAERYAASKQRNNEILQRLRGDTEVPAGNDHHVAVNEAALPPPMGPNEWGGGW